MELIITFWLASSQNINEYCNLKHAIAGCYNHKTQAIYIAHDAKDKQWVLFHEYGHHLFGRDEHTADMFAYYVQGHSNKQLMKYVETFNFQAKCDKLCVTKLKQIPIPKSYTQGELYQGYPLNFSPIDGRKLLDKEIIQL